MGLENRIEISGDPFKLSIAINMKTRSLLILTMLISVSSGYAQTFTMGKKCREALANAQTALFNKSYQDAKEDKL
jgi:hypothetical protein